ncbi:piggyBac transposable element-derived protein 3-like [Topomyia yanbarensis]|uniref:piggyBac transposable element-derived protein 3-like n=1 Tax=Topomyia yanbarensis TaxID=2498891 RepID=UPI00273B4254|nr:piggyBac transposable element-derived protein 3-like [Topomyia yanbarensis]
MARRVNKQLQRYLEDLDESEDGFEQSDSDVEDDHQYYTSSNQLIQDLEDSDLESDDDDAVAIPEEHSEDEFGANEQTRLASTVSKRAKVIPIWRSGNMIFDQNKITFLGDSALPDELMDCVTPYDFFSYFFTADLKGMIVEESNFYAAQKNISNPVSITITDLNKYLGILIYSSVAKFPNMKSYWCNKYGYDPIRTTMPQNTFVKIGSVIHFNNNDKILPKDHPQHDKLYKIRPVIKSLRERFGSIPMEQKLSIDEQMCATKIAHYMKQYLPNKPHKWGFKLYLLCSMDGFAHEFEVYTGSGNRPDLLTHEPNMGETANVVTRLIRAVPRNINHILYFDNFYTSLPLLTHLAKEGIHALGTVRLNRIKNVELPAKKDIMKKDNPRGFYKESLTTVDGIDVSAIVWKDNKPVNLLSTYVGAEPISTITRYDKKTHKRVSIQCPKAVREYNAHMGGVDLMDSLIGRYRITAKSRKWTRRLFNHLLDMTVVNSWIIYKKVSLEDKSKFLNLREFRLQLADTLCNIGSNVVKRGRPSGSGIAKELQMKKHKGPAQAVPTKDAKPMQVP